MDALVETQFARVPPFRPEPEAAHVKAALELLQKAERPIIVAGGGARASGAGKELVALAEALQIPVATSLNGKDIIPGIHPLSVGVVGTYSRESANRAVNSADLVCFIGTETGGMTTHFWAVPHIGTPAIQIDIEPEISGPQLSIGQASVLGDARSVLIRMLGQIDKSSAVKRAPWIKEIAALRADWYAKYKPTLEFGRGADPSGAHLRRIEPNTYPTMRSSSSIPATPACGWAACTICARRRKATCAAPVISAGHFLRVSVPRPHARIGPSSCSPATLASGITSPKSKRRCAGILPR